jgi:hypothetical protein
MKKLLALVFVMLALTPIQAQILPFIEATYVNNGERPEWPMNTPLKGHYVFAEAKQHTLGIMELGSIIYFRPDSTVSMKLVGYGALVIDVEASYKFSPGNVLTFQMISVSNPELSEQLVHFFDVPIYYSITGIENNTSKGVFIVLSGEHAMRDHKGGSKQDKTGFQFTFSYMK